MGLIEKIIRRVIGSSVETKDEKDLYLQKISSEFIKRSNNQFKYDLKFKEVLARALTTFSTNDYSNPLLLAAILIDKQFPIDKKQFLIQAIKQKAKGLCDIKYEYCPSIRELIDLEVINETESLDMKLLFLSLYDDKPKATTEFCKLFWDFIHNKKDGGVKQATNYIQYMKKFDIENTRLKMFMLYIMVLYIEPDDDLILSIYHQLTNDNNDTQIKKLIAIEEKTIKWLYIPRMNIFHSFRNDLHAVLSMEHYNSGEFFHKPEIQEEIQIRQTLLGKEFMKEFMRISMNRKKFINLFGYIESLQFAHKKTAIQIISMIIFPYRYRHDNINCDLSTFSQLLKFAKMNKDWAEIRSSIINSTLKQNFGGITGNEIHIKALQSMLIEDEEFENTLFRHLIKAGGNGFQALFQENKIKMILMNKDHNIETLSIVFNNYNFVVSIIGVDSVLKVVKKNSRTIIQNIDIITKLNTLQYQKNSWKGRQTNSILHFLIDYIQKQKETTILNDEIIIYLSNLGYHEFILSNHIKEC